MKCVQGGLGVRASRGMLPNIPAVVVTEESQDLLEGFVFGLRYLLVREYPEYG